MTQTIAQIPKKQIADFCQRWKIAEFALFGSILREDFRPDSDIDVLVAFAAEARVSLLDLVTMKEELEVIFGRNIDLANKRDIENSHNWIRRREILGTAQVLYSTIYSAIPQITAQAIEKKPSSPERYAMRDRASLLDIAQFGRTVLEIARGIERAELDSDVIKRSAILYQIAILGEAVKRLSREFRDRHPEIPWQKIAGMRDIVTHQYDRVDLDIVWEAIQNNIPELLATIEPLLPTEENPENPS